jgi:hypothetical protein
MKKASDYLKIYLATLIAFFAIDMLWLGLVARTFYQKYLGFLLAPKTNWIHPGNLSVRSFSRFEGELAQKHSAAGRAVWAHYLRNL